MAWIESHQELATHPKTKRLATQLGVSLPAAIGHLHLLWYWALTHAEDGDLTGYSVQEIAAECQWSGDPDHFVEGLVSCGGGIKSGAGFLERDAEGNLCIHDWMLYAGRLLNQRENNARRVRVWRSKARSPRPVAEPVQAAAPAPTPEPAAEASTKQDATAAAEPVPGDTSPAEAAAEPVAASQGEASEPVACDVPVTYGLRTHNVHACNVATVPNRTVPDRTHASSAPSVPTPSAPARASPEAHRLAELLRGCIVANHPTARCARDDPALLPRWAREVERLLRVDGRSPPEVERVIRWCQADAFWRANILSPAKLRQKWDTLWLQMQRPNRQERGYATVIRGTDRAGPDPGAYTNLDGSPKHISELLGAEP